MRVHKQDTARYPTLLEAMGEDTVGKKVEKANYFGSLENNPVLLSQKYSHILQNLILFEKETAKLSSIDDVLEKLKKSIRRIVPFKSADIFFFTESKGELKPISSSFDRALLETANHYYKEGILTILLNNRSPIFVPDLKTYSEKGSDFNYLFFPVILDNIEKGILIIKSTLHKENYSELDEQTVLIILNSAMNKLEKFILRDRLNKAYEELQTYQGKLSNEFRLAAIGELTEGILEEITSPLQVIISLVDLLDLDETNSVEIGQIKTQVNKIDKIVKRLVRFTNLNHKDIQIQPININKAIEDYYKLVNSTLKSANIECVLDLQENIPSILSHSTYIHQILTNLFGLVKNRSRKTKGIIIQTRSKGDDIVLRFVTTFPLDENLTEKNLNLKIVNNLIKKHEGDSHIQDTLDSGSVIVLRFPLIRKIRG